MVWRDGLRWTVCSACDWWFFLLIDYAVCGLDKGRSIFGRLRSSFGILLTWRLCAWCVEGGPWLTWAGLDVLFLLWGLWLEGVGFGGLVLHSWARDMIFGHKLSLLDISQWCRFEEMALCSFRAWLWFIAWLWFSIYLWMITPNSCFVSGAVSISAIS